MRHGTYSITALDPDTGECGVAVQSHWFSVGSLCAFARPGVGAVATQSVVEPAYGPRTLDRIEAGAGAQEALAGLLAGDDLRRVRQVGVVAARGGHAVHTGADCFPYAGHVTGAGATCQANMMASEGVPETMLAAFEAATGDLPARLLAALAGAEGAGGDVRGRQSAALLVVPAQGEPWRTRVSLRVEDHADPVGELERLLRLHRAYSLADAGDAALAEGRHDVAAVAYEQATALAPESDELRFWAGLGVALTDVAAGAEHVRRAAAVNPRWLTLLDRLSEDFAPAGPAVRRALGR
jgi:uncharacterized Ntn-hydrolase superfamily protein